MRLGIVGGRLQGTEAAYLGLQAGYEIVLVDRRPETPASGLAAETHVFDVMRDPARARAVLGSCDAVLPTCEDIATLEWLSHTVPSWGVPCAFHLSSYRVTSSKLRSDAVFAELDVPRPLPWPECGFPVVVKPSGTSGSESVYVARDQAELGSARAVLEAAGHEVVVQQFVDGPSLSLEVLRYGDGAVVPLVPTLLEFDRVFDCKRVLAPAASAPAVLEALAAAARSLAEGVGLVGLMDVEVMVDGDVPRVIEIDARLPSQTPTAVFHCTGINLVVELVEVFLGGGSRRMVADEGRSGGHPPGADSIGSSGRTGGPRGVCYQHVHARDGGLAVLGEHVMSGAGPLHLVHSEAGSDEMLTDRFPGAREWSATLVCVGAGHVDARARAHEATCRLATENGLVLQPESGPPPRAHDRSGARLGR